MIEPLFFAVFIFGKSPENLILLDLITTDDAFPSHYLIGSVDVKDLVFGLFDKILSLFPDRLFLRLSPLNNLTLPPSHNENS